MAEERVRDGTWSDESTCAGFLGPCDNKPDPAYLLRDPDGKDSPVHLCRECSTAVSGFFRKISDQGKMGQFEKLLDRAEAELQAGLTTNERGET